MKAYTDIEQSKKLAEVLPINSADMKFPYFGDGQYGSTALFGEPIEFSGGKDIPCWSLAALLDVLNKKAYSMDEDASVNLSSCKTIEWDLGIFDIDLEIITKTEPVDACYEFIIKLHKQKFL